MLATEHDETLLQKQNLQAQVEKMRTGNESQAARIKELEETLHKEMHTIVSLREELESQQHRKAELEAKADRLAADLEKYRSEQQELGKVRSESQAQEERLAERVREMESQAAECEDATLKLENLSWKIGAGKLKPDN